MREREITVTGERRGKQFTRRQRERNFGVEQRLRRGEISSLETEGKKGRIAAEEVTVVTTGF